MKVKKLKLQAETQVLERKPLLNYQHGMASIKDNKVLINLIFFLKGGLRCTLRAGLSKEANTLVRKLFKDPVIVMFLCENWISPRLSQLGNLLRGKLIFFLFLFLL
jgi:hypothetical protein